MISGLRLLVVMMAAFAAGSALGAPTRSSTLVLAPNDVVFVVNPDSDSVSRIAYDQNHVGTLTHEAGVGTYPRTVALAGSHAPAIGAYSTRDTYSYVTEPTLHPPKIRVGKQTAASALAPGSRDGRC